MRWYKWGNCLMAVVFSGVLLWWLKCALVGEKGHVFMMVMCALWIIRCLAEAFCRGSYEEYLERRTRHRAAARSLFGRWAGPVEYFGWALMLVSLPWALLDGYAPVPSALFLAGLVYAMAIDRVIERRAEREMP